MQQQVDNDNDGSTTVAIKVTMIISILLIAMDILEIYISLGNLHMAAEKFDADVFESCIKYHIISQMVFTFFALLAGISAFFLSLFLLFDNDFVVAKFYKTFLHWNHLVFGPYLLAATILGFVYFYEVSFNCDPRDLTRKYLNISTVMSMVICFLISALISVVFSFCYAVRKIMLSIRFRPGGWKFLGRYFWTYVRNNNPGEPSHNSNQRVNENQARNNVRIDYVEMNQIRENHENSHLEAQRPDLTEERRKRAEENIRKRIEEEEKKDPMQRRIALNSYTIKRLDDTGSFEDPINNFQEENKEEDNKSNEHQLDD